jgi:multiple sugar transport system permease protein
MTLATRRRTIEGVTFTLLVLIAVVIAFPVFWLLLTSLKTTSEIYSVPITFLPQQLTFEHYEHLLGMDFGLHFMNSVIISGGTMVLSLLLGLFPAYAFARYRFPGRGFLLGSVLLFQMFPMAVLLVPTFRLLRDLGLLNTRLGLILSYVPYTTPITIVFLRSFFISIPRSLEEAGLIDGCTLPQVFFKIILPVTIPGIAAVGIYTFLFSWAELMYALAILVTSSVQNLPVFLSIFVGEYATRWGPLFAGSMIAMIPPLILFMLLQRYFIHGLTSGSVKG